MWETSDKLYRVDDETADRLGPGGMAEVFRATHARTGDQVAIKLANPDDARRRLVREIRVLGTYEGPHMIPVLDMAATAEPDWYTHADRVRQP